MLSNCTITQAATAAKRLAHKAMKDATTTQMHFLVIVLHLSLLLLLLALSSHGGGDALYSSVCSHTPSRLTQLPASSIFQRPSDSVWTLLSYHAPCSHDNTLCTRYCARDALHEYSARTRYFLHEICSARNILLANTHRLLDLHRRRLWARVARDCRAGHRNRDGRRMHRLGCRLARWWVLYV